jgi:hypothetical protein
MEAVSVNAPPSHAAQFPLRGVTLSVASTLPDTISVRPCAELPLY